MAPPHGTPFIGSQAVPASKRLCARHERRGGAPCGALTPGGVPVNALAREQHEVALRDVATVADTLEQDLVPLVDDDQGICTKVGDGHT